MFNLVGKRGKKVVLLLFVILIMVSFIGCRGGNSSDVAGENGGDVSGEKVVIKYGHSYPTGHPHYRAAEDFKQFVEEESGGALEIQLYPDSQLGNQRETIEGTQSGSIEMVVQSVAFVNSFVPDFQVLDLPFLFETEEKVWEVLNGPAGDKLLEKVEEVGLIGLGWTGTGFLQITNDKNIEVHSPEDLKGLKVRIMQSPIKQAQYETWGANPIAISLSELYNALQQGTVDGQENDLITIDTQKYYEVQSNMSVSDHAYLVMLIMANQDWFNNLTTEQQEIIKNGVDLMVENHAQYLAEDEPTLLQKIEDGGVEIYTLTPEEREAFRVASEPVWEIAKNIVSPEIVDIVVEYATK